ncbi:MAG: hypothetical protein O7J95_16115 [Planctomycetota bacterium]|nr:hypothetical protein [Planctomycetota bacterium]
MAASPAAATPESGPPGAGEPLDTDGAEDPGGTEEAEEAEEEVEAAEPLAGDDGQPPQESAGERSEAERDAPTASAGEAAVPGPGGPEGRDAPGSLGIGTEAEERAWLLRAFPEEYEADRYLEEYPEGDPDPEGDGIPGLGGGEAPAARPVPLWAERLGGGGRFVVRAGEWLRTALWPLVRLVRWFLGERATEQLARPVEMRLSTLIMSTISLVIVLGLIGIWLTAGHGGKSGLFPTTPGGEPWPEWTSDASGATGASERAETSDEGVSGSGAKGVEGPLWGEREGGTIDAEFRNVETAESPAAGTADFNPERYWLRVRALMDEKECGDLVKHLSHRVMGYLERSVATSRAKSSIAWKEIVRVPMRDEPGHYYVYIGPFGSRKLAEAAKEEIKETTRDGLLRFRRNRDYFSETYVVYERPGIAAHRTKLWHSRKGAPAPSGD